MIYIGAAGPSSVTTKHKDAPMDEARLPVISLKLSQGTNEALSKAVLAGRVQQDNSNGYALAVDPELRVNLVRIRR